MTNTIEAHTLRIHAEWDTESSVWVATSEEVPGLVTEVASIELLVERLKRIIPERMPEIL